MTSMTLTCVLMAAFSCTTKAACVKRTNSATCLTERKRPVGVFNELFCFVIQWSYFCLFILFLFLWSVVDPEPTPPCVHRTPSDPLCETMQHAELLPPFLIETLCTEHCNLTTEMMTTVETIVSHCLCKFPVLSC